MNDLNFVLAWFCGKEGRNRNRGERENLYEEKKEKGEEESRRLTGMEKNNGRRGQRERKKEKTN